jgi:hypothetical protein
VSDNRDDDTLRTAATSVDGGMGARVLALDWATLKHIEARVHVPAS